jgi:hypothetical protein
MMHLSLVPAVRNAALRPSEQWPILEQACQEWQHAARQLVRGDDQVGDGPWHDRTREPVPHYASKNHGVRISAPNMKIKIRMRIRPRRRHAVC